MKMATSNAAARMLMVEPASRQAERCAGDFSGEVDGLEAGAVEDELRSLLMSLHYSIRGSVAARI